MEFGKKNRQQTHQKRPDAILETATIDLDDFTLKSQGSSCAAIVLSPSAYRFQEQVMLGLDRYIRAIFSPTGGRWSFNMFSFIRDTGDTTTFIVWERIADQCTTIEDLVKQDFVGTAEYLMKDLLDSLPTSSRITDPSMLLQLWQACLKLLSIDEQNVFTYSTLSRFLDTIKEKLAAAKRAQGDLATVVDPLQDVVDALASISRPEMKEAIRLATFKTAIALQETIGDENIMVLSMWSFYCRTWRTSERSRHTLLEKLEHVWRTNLRTRDADTVATSYYYTYAVHNISKDVTKSANLAQVLVHNLETEGFSDEPTWGMRTLAFQVCSKLLARHHRSCAFVETVQQETVDKRFEYYQTMEKAINVLKQGDILCRVAAASMATTLGYWLQKSRLPRGENMDWHGHARTLLMSLPELEHE